MATPPSLKRLAAENFDDAEDWFKEAFLPQLNGFLGDVVNALSRSLNGDNILREDRVLAFETGGTVAIDTAPFPLLLKPQLVRRPQSVVVLNPAVDGEAPVGAAQVIFRLTADGDVAVRLVTGLDASKKYKMLLRLE
jgi:hypothetical protein